MTTTDPFAPARLGPLELRNHVVKAATFEGMSPNNLVTRTLVDFHRRMAAGGVAMTTVSYIAVMKNGMGAPSEIYIHDAAADGLAQIAAVVHAEGAKIAAQIGHAGAVGNLPGKKVLGPSKSRSLQGYKVEPISLGEIDEVVAAFGRAARMLREAGFDSVEVHLGHHYLLSSFLSPKWNKRTDDYGGSIENRARLPRRVLQAVRENAGPGMAVTAKMNMVDGIKGGLQIEDSIQAAKLFESDGTLDALELTGGGSQQNQMFMFRGDAPRKEMEAILPNPQRLGFKLLGRVLFKEYPFEEGYFLPLARRFRQELTMPLIYLGGVNSVATMEKALGEGFDLVAMGRALVREPDLINRMREGRASSSNCIHCNKCMVSIFTGTRCVIDDPAPLQIVP